MTLAVDSFTRLVDSFTWLKVLTINRGLFKPPAHKPLTYGLPFFLSPHSLSTHKLSN